MAKRLNKKEIFKEAILILLKEVKTSRADVKQTAIDDSNQVVGDHPDFVAPGDEMLQAMDDTEENDRYWRDKFEEEETLHGFDPYEFDPIRDRREEEEAYQDFLKSQKEDESKLDMMRGQEEFNDNALERLQEIALRQMIKKMIQENYYNFSPTPNAEPVKSNGNGVASVIAMKGTPKPKNNKASKEAEIEKTPVVKQVSDKFNKAREAERKKK